MRILLAVDDSEASELAVRSVVDRPWPQESIVRVLTVVDKAPPSAAELLLEGGGSTQIVQEERDVRGEHFVRQVAESLPPGLKAEFAVREGDPRREIVSEAQTWDADLIIVGSHGQRGIARLLIGSVARGVVEHAPCSVEVSKEGRTAAVAGNASHGERGIPLADCVRGW